MHTWSRLLKINLALWGHVAWLMLVRLRLLTPAVPPPQRLARVLEELGTTFVKLGQGLSLHRELLPDDYVAQLQRLQDHVEPFAPALSRQEVERSFGNPVEALFASFEAEPFAAGSVAQVHRAQMADGRPVVVKVRRPGIRRMVEEDVRILRWFLRSVLWLVPAAQRLRPFELVDELSRNLHKEIDFREEALNMQRFQEVFRSSGEIYVPAVVDRMYTEWVIVQEMSMGQRIDDPAFRSSGPRLASCLVEAYLKQFFQAGVFHGDPHPGNLFVLPDGRICLHDFGLIGFLDRGTRLNLVAFMLAFAQQDADWLLDAFLDLGMIAGSIDRAELRLGLAEVIQDYARKPLRDWSFGEAFLRVGRLGRGQNVRIPHHLLVLMRAVFLMENTVRKLDPDFNLVEGLFARAGAVLQQAEQGGTPAGADRLRFESLLLAGQAPRSLGRLLHEARALLQEWEFRRPQPTAPAVEPAARRLGSAILAAGLFVGAAWLLVREVGPVVFGVPLVPAAVMVAGVLLARVCLKRERA